MIRISIDRKRIEANRLNHTDLPVIALEHEHTTQCVWVRGITILGPSTVVYDPEYDDEGHLGAAWVETDSDIEID